MQTQPLAYKNYYYDEAINPTEVVSQNDNKHSYSIIKSYNRFGQLNHGVEKGPKFLTENPYFKTMMNEVIPYEYKWVQSFIKENIYTHNYNDMVYDINNMNNIVEVEAVARSMHSDNVFSSSISDLTINLMGDHSASIGTFNSNDNKKILVWIDSKPDIEIPMSSKTGNINEMQVGFISGISHLLMPEDYNRIRVFPFISNKLPMENIIYIGSKHRSFFAEQIIQENDIMVIDEDSSSETLIKFQNKIRDNNIHISVDVSAFGRKCFPCANSSLRGDLSPPFVSQIISDCVNYGIVTCLDIAEFNPINMPNKTINNCVDIIVDNIIYPAMTRS
jgi:arginase family enzyme